MVEANHVQILLLVIRMVMIVCIFCPRFFELNNLSKRCRRICPSFFRATATAEVNRLACNGQFNGCAHRSQTAIGHYRTKSLCDNQLLSFWREQLQCFGDLSFGLLHRFGVVSSGMLMLFLSDNGIGMKATYEYRERNSCQCRNVYHLHSESPQLKGNRNAGPIISRRPVGCRNETRPSRKIEKMGKHVTLSSGRHLESSFLVPKSVEQRWCDQLV